MKVSTQVTFKNMKSSRYLQTLIDKELEKLDEFSVHISHCRVTIERVENHGLETYKVDTFINFPGNEVLVEIDTNDYPDCKRVSAAIHESFFQVRHRLMKKKGEDVKRNRRRIGLKQLSEKHLISPERVEV